VQPERCGQRGVARVFRSAIAIPVILVGTVRRLLLAAAIVALASAGCATAKAKTGAEPAPLEVPAPPPRVIVPPDPDPEPIQPPAPAPEPEPKSQKPARRVVAPRAETKADSARVADPSAPAPPPTATLQQALPGTPAEVARQVREQLAQAQTDLGRVNYKALNADAKSQYDTAKRFITQAEQALKEGNFVFAAKVAEKAAGLAASLPGR
jgi:hypothetical protein